MHLAATAIQAGLVALAATCALMLYQARLAARSKAVHEAENLVRVLQDGIETEVQVADLSLRNVDLDLRFIEQNHLAPELRTTVLTNDALPAQAYGSLLVTDEAGRAIFFSTGLPPTGIDVSRRAYFIDHRDHPDAGLTLDLLTSSLVSGEPIVVVTRRIDHPDGSFAGVAVESMRLSLFKTLFDSVEVGPDDDILLNTSDSRVIFRRRFGARFFGLDLTDTPVAQALKTSPTGIVEGASALDGVPRLWARRKLNNIGLTVAVGLSVRGVYAAWRHEAVIIGPAITCLLLSAILLGLGLRRQLSRRERAEAALRTSEAQFRLLSEAASDMVSRVDATGQRRYVSPASARLLGLPPEALLGTAALDLVVAEDRAALQGAAAEVSAGEPRRANVEFRVRRVDGPERWIDAVARAINDPVTGAPDGYIAAWRDVTDRKEAENRLVESETRYRLLTESATDIITCLDLDLRRTYVSPACRAVLGYEPEDLLGIDPPRTVHPDESAFVEKRFRMLAEGLLEREVLTNRFRHKAGHYIWVEAKITLMRDPVTTKPAKILCVVRDISDRKAAADGLLAVNQDLERLSRHLAKARDAAERASEAKTRFLAGVSHELRTPLNGIMGYAELLQIEGGLNETQTARVDAMQAAGQHLLSMITEVLDLSEIETGHLDLHVAEFDLAEVIAACVAVVQPLAQRKGLLLGSRPEASGGAAASPSIALRADAMRLRQILVNLLGNAVKFTQSGSVEVGFRLAEGGVRIEVADTGPGIPPHDRWRLFQEFDRLGGEAVQTIEGSGLGLALSERLTKAMGGTIGYADNPGGGSVFWLELPLGPVEPSPAPPRPAQTAASGQAASGSSWRVLVVDDVSINRDIAASFLAAAGHQPTCAAGGEDAVKLAAEQDFDIVLMDVRMPGLDGREAARRIRSLSGIRSQVPIVALTAQALADEVAECRRAGMNEHLAKPFTQSALLATMTAALDGSRPAPLPDADQTSSADPQHHGADFPILNRAVFDQTAGYLTVETVAGHLNSLIRRTEALLGSLEQAHGRVDADPKLDESLKAAAHILAGSAGMFGFERLSAVARQLDNSAEPCGAVSPRMAESLRAAAIASLCDMRGRLAQPAVIMPAAATDMAAAESSMPAW